MADWEAEWNNFKIAGLLQGDTEKHQLGTVLGETYLKVFGRLGATAYEALNEQQQLNNAKQLVVKKRNKYVHRYRLIHM